MSIARISRDRHRVKMRERRAVQSARRGGIVGGGEGVRYSGAWLRRVRAERGVGRPA